MRTEKEVKDTMEVIKTQLPTTTSDRGIAELQGQYAALDWILSTDETKEKEVEE